MKETFTYTVEGLQAPVEMLLDRWGVPHLYASSIYDAFFAQGFNAARDRLWQIDLWRRRGLGLLSEVYGADFIEKDRAARLFLYRGDMRNEWLSYGSDAKRVVTAFVCGINEYVRFTEQDPTLLPEEFHLMGYRPMRWSPEDVPRIRSHGLYKNLSSEVKRARILRDFGYETERLRNPLNPPHELTIPEGLDLFSIPDDVLRVYELATIPPTFGEDLAYIEKPLEGSNNWALSSSRTSTGRPILANDPHRAQSVPSLRYVAHLSAPGMDVIGAGEPALPGISIGHNGHIAFGLTIFSIDQEDLYVYETNPENPEEYLYQGRWEPMQVEHQSLPIKDGGSEEVELRFTRHGPVIYEDPEKHMAFAVRAAWLEPGMAPYLGSMEYMRSKDWDGFLAAMNRWGSPGENQVFADTEGNIAWKAAGLVPRRPNWDGLLPVPGDGRYEWDGFLDADELPTEHNPERGWVATANQMNLPDGYPYERKKISFEWHAPYRYERIAEVLKDVMRDTMEHGPLDSVNLQTDYLSIPARRVISRLGGLSSKDPKASQAIELLKSWNHILSADSAPAVLFEVWFRLHLRRSLMEKALSGTVPPEKLCEAVASAMPIEEQAGYSEATLNLLENPSCMLGPAPEQSLNELLLASLKQAILHLEHLLGEDWTAWEWGQLHYALLIHPLSALAGEGARERLDVGPAPRGGSGDTVGNTAYAADNFRQTGGASFRVVFDVGAWDDSLFMNSPGQSGDPAGRHYDDLFEEWAADGAYPLLYSKEQVDKATERRLLLKPDGDSS